MRHEKNNRHHTKITRSERFDIGTLRAKGYAVRNIARHLGRSHSSILDELKRNRVRGRYDPRKADHKAYVRRRDARYQGLRIVAHQKLRAFVERLLYDDQSPEAIAGRLTRSEQRLPRVSKDTIYRYIKSPYGRRVEAYRWLKRRRRRRKHPRAKPLTDRTFIDRRPAYINKRMRVGDAEGDFIVSGASGKGRLLVVVDRKLRIAFLEPIRRLSLAAVTAACLGIKARYPEWRSMTTDNDILFRHHKELERILGIRIYFCHPYHSWEKGSVEHTNKIIRRDIPKGNDLSRYTKKYIRGVEAKLNRRIMKILRYRTPQEMMDTHRKRKKRRSAEKRNKKMRWSD